MRNIKTLLRLLGAVSLTTVAASSVVACGTKTPEEHADDAKLLGWYDADGKSLIEQKLNYDNTVNNEKYSIDAVTTLITGTNFKNKLLKEGTGADTNKFKAINADAAKLLKELKFTSGSESKDYSTDDIAKISSLTVIVNGSVSGKIEKNGTDDFKVAAGTCKIEVKSSSTILKTFNIQTKESNLLVPDAVGKIIQKSAGAWNITFEGTPVYKRNQPVITELPWNSDSEGQKAKKQFDALLKILNLNNPTLLWSSDNQGQNQITTYNNTTAFLTIKFSEIKVWGTVNCGIPPA